MLHDRVPVPVLVDNRIIDLANPNATGTVAQVLLLVDNRVIDLANPNAKFPNNIYFV